MSNIPKVSVIVPIYNVEKYLCECLDSIVNQTLKDIEIICVNDGSSDESLAIAEKYSFEDKRLTVISQQNKGQSAARNYGMKFAHGEYVYFIDSDDYIDLNALEVLYNTAVDNDTDIVYFGADCFYESEKLKGKLSSSENYYRRKATNNVLDSESMIEYFRTCLSFNVCIWLQFYRRAFLTENHLSFFEGIIREDELFCAIALCRSKSSLVIENTFYKYRVREQSTMTASSAAKMFNGCFIASYQLNEEALTSFTPDSAQYSFLTERSAILLDDAKYFFDSLDTERQSSVLTDLPPQTMQFQQEMLRSNGTAGTFRFARKLSFLKRNGLVNTTKRVLASFRQNGLAYTLKKIF